MLISTLLGASLLWKPWSCKTRGHSHKRHMLQSSWFSSIYRPRWSSVAWTDGATVAPIWCGCCDSQHVASAYHPWQQLRCKPCSAVQQRHEDDTDRAHVHQDAAAAAGCKGWPHPRQNIILGRHFVAHPGVHRWCCCMPRRCQIVHDFTADSTHIGHWPSRAMMLAATCCLWLLSVALSADHIKNLIIAAHWRGAASLWCWQGNNDFGGSVCRLWRTDDLFCQRVYLRSVQHNDWYQVGRPPQLHRQLCGQPLARCAGKQAVASSILKCPVCAGCRKLLQTASPAVVLDVWTNSMAANFTPSEFWGGVFTSGALESLGPRQANWTGAFLNATMHLVCLHSHMIQLLRQIRLCAATSSCASQCWMEALQQPSWCWCCGCACCRGTSTRRLWGLRGTRLSPAKQGGHSNHSSIQCALLTLASLWCGWLLLRANSCCCAGRQHSLATQRRCLQVPLPALSLLRWRRQSQQLQASAQLQPDTLLTVLSAPTRSISTRAVTSKTTCCS